MTQKSITSFFKLANQTRKKPLEAHNQDNLNPGSLSNEFVEIKKIKLSKSTNENFQINAKCVSTCGVEQKLTADKQEIATKHKAKAELDLQCHQSAALHRNIGIGWYEALKPEFSKEYFIELSKFLICERSKYTIYPPEQQVFSWTHYCDIKDIKVVILGQDPYHGVGQAHGLCFSVQIGVHPPPSLMNMYKELENDISGFKRPGHGFLAGWARQGVLLLNACLTVRASNANSHKDKGWEKLTDAVIQTISDSNKNVIFLLWGSYAQKKAAIVDRTRHHLLDAPHPSPLSAHRGFFGCRHFSKCNKLLEENGSMPIDWSLLPPE